MFGFLWCAALLKIENHQKSARQYMYGAVQKYVDLEDPVKSFFNAYLK